jgi:SulP family sulfate permease
MSVHLLQRAFRALPLIRSLTSAPVDMRSEVSAGLTVGAMLIPQSLAYALIAGMPPEAGLYAATVPVVIYALFGTSRQLAVGPVAIVSLLTASALAPIFAEGSASYIEAAAVLALLVGVFHLVLGAARAGFIVNLLSHSVLVGFSAAAAIIIGVSQAKHLLGISVERQDSLIETVSEVVRLLSETHITTLVFSFASLAALVLLRRTTPRLPNALIVVLGSIAAVKIFGLDDRGVKVVGDVPSALPWLTWPSLNTTLVGQLLVPAIAITMVGFLESVAVAKTYARKNGYEIDANQDLIGLGGANVAAGLFGGFPVTGGFSRTAVNADAGAKSQAASLISAGVVLGALAFLTPLFELLPNAVLAVTIMVAVVGLIDVAEIRQISIVKRSDMIGLSAAFFGTVILGVEIGIVVAVAASILVVFTRMSLPHSAVLGNVEGTTSYRNLARFPNAQAIEGIEILRVDAAVSFVNSANVKKLLLAHADHDSPKTLVLDASGINDLDASGAAMFTELLDELDERGVPFHMTEVKGPVRDVLRAAGIWDRLDGHIHASNNLAAQAISSGLHAPRDQRQFGIDENAPTPQPSNNPSPTHLQ